MAIQRSRLNPSWVRKWLIFGTIVLGFGTWGLYDALIIYPKRGEEDVSYRLTEYLAAADRSGQLASASINGDPKVALTQLRAQEKALRTAASADTAAGRAATTELAKLEWLSALARVGRLTEQRTGALAPELTKSNETLKTLQDQWRGKERPKPLDDLDLPLQWVFFGIGYLGAGYFAWLILSRKARVFTWDDETKKLTLPSGAAMTPGELVEVDKRQWHKYYVTLGTSDGAKHTIDLQSHVPVEDWVLEMERIAFPESQETPAAGAAGDKPAETAAAGPEALPPIAPLGPGPQGP